jgi:hypothetical protein
MKKFITFSRLGEYGRLGNQLFQFAALKAFSLETGRDIYLPDTWKFNNLNKKYKTLKIYQHEGYQKESQFHYDETFVEKLKDKEDTILDVLGYFQSEEYFVKYKKEILEDLRFSENDIIYTYDKCTVKNAFNKKTVAIHIRRGDYVNNPNYHNLSINYYINILEKYFDEERYNIIVFSDDIEYAKIQFQAYNNVYFSERLTEFEDLVLMSLCDNHIIANSTYSWWAAYLSSNFNKNYNLTICPNKVFEGKLEENSLQSFYPNNWLIEETNIHLSLKDTTFTIPVKIDSTDRLENLELTLTYLNNNFKTNVIIAENSEDEFRVPLHTYAKFDNLNITYIAYSKFEMPVFHRTKLLNEMALNSSTPYIVNWDCDVIIPVLQLYRSIKLLKQDLVCFVYPYDGRFARVERENIYRFKSCNYDIAVLTETFRGMFPTDKKSVGGVVCYNKIMYFKAGGENENFISWAPEDEERYLRVKKLYGDNSIKRIKGALYHFQHYVGNDSSNENPYFKHNLRIFYKISEMSYRTLHEEIQTWTQTIKS